MKQLFSNFKSDFPAGIVVFLVSVPLCLGIAAVSGVPAFSGLIAGIVGGIIVGAFSGSQLGVSGPAAGLAVIVFQAVENFRAEANQQLTAIQITAEALEMFFLAVLIAGVIQLILGFFVPNNTHDAMRYKPGYK